MENDIEWVWMGIGAHILFSLAKKKAYSTHSPQAATRSWRLSYYPFDSTARSIRIPSGWKLNSPWDAFSQPISSPNSKYISEYLRYRGFPMPDFPQKSRSSLLQQVGIFRYQGVNSFLIDVLKPMKSYKINTKLRKTSHISCRTQVNALVTHPPSGIA